MPAWRRGCDSGPRCPSRGSRRPRGGSRSARRLEAFGAIRGAWLGGKIADDDLDRITQRLAALDLDVWPTVPLLPRIRELASNATACDAAYLALAEEIGSPLVTADAKFASIPGIRCRVVGWGDG